MRFTIAGCAVTALVLSATGCVNSKPVHYYTLELPSAPIPQSKPDGLVVLVGNISVPVALEDGRIRYRTGSNEAGAYEYHRWIERPGMMVSASLVHALRASGQYRRVTESGSSAAGDYLLRGKLSEFGEVDRDGIQTRVSLELELLDLKTRRNVWDRVVEREEPVAGRNVQDVVQSLDRNLQAVVQATTAEIDRFLAAK
jgi:cholesterol transport system auxiliary component